MKLLIGGKLELTKNYQDVLTHMNIDFDVLSSFTNANELHLYAGLILPGGGDIEPSLFGQANAGSHGIDFSLDLFQLKLVEHFSKMQKPILGICKGLQIINVFYGGTIIQDLSSKTIHQYDKEDKIHHTFMRHNSFLESIYGTSGVTNSAHHQGVGALGKNLKIIQIAPDGVVEAIQHTSLPIIGVQWHPERMCFSHKREDTLDGSLLFEYFVQTLIQKTDS